MEQLPELIYIDGVLHALYTTPLLPWLDARQPPPDFDRRAPNCERGYVATWKISAGQLWLTSLHAWRDGVYTGLAQLFGERSEVAADWFSGPLVVEPAANEIAAGARPEVLTLLVERGQVTTTLRRAGPDGDEA